MRSHCISWWVGNRPCSVKKKIPKTRNATLTSRPDRIDVGEIWYIVAFNLLESVPGCIHTTELLSCSCDVGLQMLLAGTMLRKQKAIPNPATYAHAKKCEQSLLPPVVQQVVDHRMPHFR
jgi:hypothetical protein